MFGIDTEGLLIIGGVFLYLLWQFLEDCQRSRLRAREVYLAELEAQKEKDALERAKLEREKGS